MSVPFVIITGFLGAGKTTLVNRLLARRAARDETRKLGVIVNELGEVGIDGALIGGDVAKQVELPGGCVCCVLGDELDKTVLGLLDSRELEGIVLETTGVAEPLPITWALAREPVASRVRVVAVITLVDATNFLASRAVSAAVGAQVAYADVLLITKAELAGADETRAVEDTVRELAPRALIRRGTADEHAAYIEELLADPEVTSAAPADDGHDHDHADHGHGHAHGVDSVSIELRGVADVEELEDQLATLPASYVRIKGIVQADDQRWFAVHRVGPRVSSEALARMPDGYAPGVTRFVALGRQLDQAELRKCVDRALTSP